MQQAWHTLAASCGLSQRLEPFTGLAPPTGRHHQSHARGPGVLLKEVPPRRHEARGRKITIFATTPPNACLDSESLRQWPNLQSFKNDLRGLFIVLFIPSIYHFLRFCFWKPKGGPRNQYFNKHLYNTSFTMLELLRFTVYCHSTQETLNG